MAKKKHIASAVLFAALILLLTGIFSVILYPRNNRMEEETDAISGNKLLGESPGTVDVLFVGDSQAYASVSPMELWKNEGITSFVSGNGGQPTCEMPDFVRAAMKEQKLKTVVFEADTLYIGNSMGKYAYTKLKNAVPLLQYHNRWKTIGTDKFTFRKDFSETDDLKGYRYSPAIEPYYFSYPEYMNGENGTESVSMAARLSLKEIKSLCDRNGAQLLILNVPNLNWSRARHNGVQELADSLGADYLDMNLPCGMEPIDWKNEAKDYGVHVNHAGAVRVSAYIGAYLKENYDLTDRRNDPDCRNWNEAFRKYGELTGE